jgi:hypothetical protein
MFLTAAGGVHGGCSWLFMGRICISATWLPAGLRRRVLPCYWLLMMDVLEFIGIC